MFRQICEQKAGSGEDGSDIRPPSPPPEEHQSEGDGGSNVLFSAFSEDEDDGEGVYDDVDGVVEGDEERLGEEDDVGDDDDLDYADPEMESRLFKWNEVERQRREQLVADGAFDTTSDTPFTVVDGSKGVHFDQVTVREYGRLLGGSSCVLKQGAIALGLSLSLIHI